MVDYSSLIAKWPLLTGPSPSASVLAAAKAAFDLPKPAPIEHSKSAEAVILAYEEAEKSWYLGWSAVFRTPEVLAKLSQLNTLVVPGPSVDVRVSDILAEMLLDGSYVSVQEFSTSTGNSNAVHDAALIAAKTLVTTVQNASIVPVLKTSDPVKGTLIKRMLDALLKQETAVPGTTGVTQRVHDELIGLITPSIPWWQANSLVNPVGEADLESVLITSSPSSPVWLV